MRRELPAAGRLVGTGMDLTCPKCQAPMRSYERSGVTVDQCTECRGIFLDRGELERLVDAETPGSTGTRGGAACPAPVPPPAQQQPAYQQQYAASRRPATRATGRSRTRAGSRFLEELFD